MSSPRTGSLAVIFLIVFIDLLGFGMVLPLLPVYAKSFGHDEHGAVIGLLMASFSAMQFLFSPMWGRLSDRIGRRPVLLIGLVGSSAFYFLFGVATIWQSLAGLFVARIGAGIAGATIATAAAYIADSTTLESRTRGMALIGAAFGIGFTFGPLIGATALWFSASAEQVAASPWPGYAASILSAVAFVLAVLLLPESLAQKNVAADDAASRHGASAFSFRAWSDAFRTPSVGALMLTSFIAVVAFGGFETTLSLLLSDEKGAFQFKLHQVLLVFAFVGLVLVVIQGGVVRRLSGRVREVPLAAFGGLCTMTGFVLLVWAFYAGSIWALLLAAGVEVTGFAFMNPALQSLISRRSDPAKQGAILGVSQSVSALARITAPLVAIPLFFVNHTLPYWMSIMLLAFGLMLLFYAAGRGRDYGAASVPVGH